MINKTNKSQTKIYLILTGFVFMYSKIIIMNTLK